MKYIRKIYDWVLSWAYKPSGPKALGAISFCEASFFPIPPDVLLIPLAIGRRNKALTFSLICSLSSILGAGLGYFIGKFVWWADQNTFSEFANLFFHYIPGFTIESFQNIQNLYDEYNFIIIFTAGFTPIPFKLFTISAGAFNINFLLFIFSGAVSRSARFFLVGYLIKIYGKPIQAFIEKYFNILAILFTIFLFGGFFIIKIFI